jgi:D-alanine-D-alanine ligase
MNIVVLCGGSSPERDVSLSSGAMAAAALRRLGHRVAVTDLFLGHPTAAELSALFTLDNSSETAAVSETAPDMDALRARRVGGRGKVGGNVAEICLLADIVFIALHGEDGEDGKIQSFLDLLGVKYTGTGALGSALAMDKAAAKDLFRQYGILTPRGGILRRRDEPAAIAGFPCVVKPVSGGSSVGASIVTRSQDYLPAVALGFQYGEELMIEEYISGREVDVGVIDGSALPPIEIRPHGGFYDYKNKYQKGFAEEICPADFPQETDARLRASAEAVFRALRLEVYARMDFIVARDGAVYCLEANTLPGLTPTSLLPQEAAAVGIAYDELIGEIVGLSLKKYGERR